MASSSRAAELAALVSPALAPKLTPAMSSEAEKDRDWFCDLKASPFAFFQARLCRKIGSLDLSHFHTPRTASSYAYTDGHSYLCLFTIIVILYYIIFHNNSLLPLFAFCCLSEVEGIFERRQRSSTRILTCRPPPPLQNICNITYNILIYHNSMLLEEMGDAEAIQFPHTYRGISSWSSLLVMSHVILNL